MRAKSTLVLALIAPALVWSCGGSSEKQGGGAGAGGGAQVAGSSTAGASTTSQSGSAAAGTSSQAGTSGTAGGAGGLPAAGGAQTVGGAPVAEAGASGASAGVGGAEAWDPELLGFECDSKRCAVGQACIRCFVGETSSRICVPSPSGDPAGFEAATTGCEKPLPTTFNECDGPEDCPGTQYCVAAESANGFMRCRNEPSSVNGSCCFACGALTDCTLCRSSADCPDNAACEPAQSAPAGIMGCQRRR